MKKALQETTQRWVEKLVSPFQQQPSGDSEVTGLQSHKARILLISALILSTMGSIILVIQTLQTLHPAVAGAPAIDIVSDILTVVAGGVTIFFLTRGRLNAASYVILGVLFIMACLLLIYGHHPRMNVEAMMTLLIFSVLAMVLLEPKQAWYTFGLLTSAVLLINVARSAEIKMLPTAREPAGETLFSILTWLIGGGLVSLIFFSTTRILKNQTQQLQEQLHALHEKEQAILASEQRYRNVFEGAQDAILVENDQGDILDVNHRACEMYGYSYQEFLALKVPDIVTERGRIIDLDALKEHGGFVEGIVSENVNASGEPFPVEFSAQIQDIGEEEVMVFVLRDITERRESERAIKRQLQELKGLHRIAQVGTEEIDEDKIIETATAVIDDILSPEFHGVLTLSEDKGHLYVHPSYRNAPEKYRGTYIPVEKGITGEVARTGQARYYPDVREAPNYLRIIPEVKTELCLPITTQEKILGVLNVESTQVDAYDENDQRLLQTLAGQLATAIERARLFNTVNQQLSQMQSLRTIDRAISSSLDLNVTLNVILNQITSQLNIDAACVLLLEPHTQTLQYTKGKGFKTSSIRDAYQRVGSGLAGKAVLDEEPLHIPNLKEITTSRYRATLTRDEDFVFYCGLPLISKGKPQGILELYHRSPKPISEEWKRYAELLSGQAAIAIDNALLFEELQQTNLHLTQAYDSTLTGWARALEMRDHKTSGHTRRVTELTLELAREVGVPHQDLPQLRRGALLHDIGMIRVSDRILIKEEPLEDSEWEAIKKHPRHAKEILTPIHGLEKALDIPLHHHERWDGSGYPSGLSGENIPLPARLFAVADVWDALTHDRPYRQAWPEESALEHLREHAGTLFDPEIVEAFLKIQERKGGSSAGTGRMG